MTPFEGGSLQEELNLHEVTRADPDPYAWCSITKWGQRKGNAEKLGDYTKERGLERNYLYLYLNLEFQASRFEKTNFYCLGHLNLCISLWKPWLSNSETNGKVG